MRLYRRAGSRTEAVGPAEAAPAPPTLNAGLPAASVARAHAAFEHFTLGAQPAPRRSVVSRTADRAAVQAAHRTVMTEALDGLKDQNTARGGLRLALPRPDVERLLRTLDQQASTVELADVLAVAARHRTGAEFFAGGNPLMNRLALRVRARALVAGVVKVQPSDPAKRPTPAGGGER